MSQFHLYQCDKGQTAERDKLLPETERNDPLHHPAHYIAGAGLKQAVNIALALGQPLLLTGEPGTGKTELARSVAYELEWPRLVFHTKTTSTARDLFYQYDALSHFHDAHLTGQNGQAAKVADPPQVEKYISYEALGLAILLSKEPGEVVDFLPKRLLHNKPTRSVVLVDEVDKAPRDLPNDVLHEIENLSFQVRETRREFKAERKDRPLVILTSNSEKNLPDAFLRRCVFYHIEFPDAGRLKEIVHRRFGQDAFEDGRLDEAIAHFLKIRDEKLKKAPATAEMLAWLRIVKQLHLRFDKLDEKEREALRFSYSVLAKNKEDLEKLTGNMAVK
jgi:MoxR-like ATPase